MVESVQDLVAISGLSINLDKILMSSGVLKAGAPYML